MNYGKALDKVMKEAPTASGLSRDELEQKIARITELLKGPMSNVERIMLCGDRASLRKGLAALGETQQVIDVEVRCHDHHRLFW